MDCSFKIGEEPRILKRNVKLVQLNKIMINVPEKMFDCIVCIKNFQEGTHIHLVEYQILYATFLKKDGVVKMIILKLVTHRTPSVSPY